MVTRSCKQCGTEFEVPYPSSKRVNCSAKCRGVKTKPRPDKGIPKLGWVETTCHCGTVFLVAKSKFNDAQRRGYLPLCSPECLDQRRRKGTGRPPSGNRWTLKDGYVMVYVPPSERPPGQEKSNAFREHRIVMSKMLGRHLLPGENVHHKNGDRQDNRPENLELWVELGQQPKGAHAADLLVWAHEIIDRYEPVKDLL